MIALSDCLLNGLIMSGDSAKSIKEIDDYLGRGRTYGNLNQDDLQNLFVEIFHELARSSSFDLIIPQLHDVEAEYHLRELDPPYTLVRDDAEGFISRVSNTVNKIDAEDDK